MASEGSGGSTAAGDRLPSEEFPIGRYKTFLIADNPQVVLLLQGIVDLASPLNQTDAGIDALAHALRDDIIDARNRGAEVFISTLTAEKPPLPGYDTKQYIQSDTFMTAVNTAIRNVAIEQGATLVDGYSAIAANRAAYIGGDGLHLTPGGYQALAAAFLAAITTQYEHPSPPPAIWSGGPSIPSSRSYVEVGP